MLWKTSWKISKLTLSKRKKMLKSVVPSMPWRGGNLYSERRRSVGRGHISSPLVGHYPYFSILRFRHPLGLLVVGNINLLLFSACARHIACAGHDNKVLSSCYIACYATPYLSSFFHTLCSLP